MIIKTDGVREDPEFYMIMAEIICNKCFGVIAVISYASDIKKLSEENAAVRILEGGKKIVGKEENFYDNEILKNITPEWQKATRVLTNTLHRMKIKTGDLFLMKRMKKLIEDGKVEVMGDTTRSWKEFDVRLAGKQPEGMAMEDQQQSA